MSFRLVPNSVTLNDLERRNSPNDCVISSNSVAFWADVMAVTLRYFTEFGKPALQKTICGGIYASLLHFLVRVQFRHKESSRSLSHLLMSFFVNSVITEA